MSSDLHSGSWLSPIRTTALFLVILLAFQVAERGVPAKIWNIISGAQYESKGGEYWANEILDGGYILHFRHAERDKWIDVLMYDLLEDRSSEALEPLASSGAGGGALDRPGNYFDDAVCLNSRGETQARAVGDVINSIGLPVGDVYSSVSCRAKQTAVTSFGKAPIISRLLLHRGPFNEASDHLDSLKNFYLGLSPESPKNTLISAHNDVVSKEMFLNEGALGDMSLEEGGFYVISVTKNGLVLEHTFFTFWDFAHYHFPRE